MAYKIDLPLHSDERGKLTSIDRLLPFEIKRVFYIYEVKSPRGAHRHKECQLALIALNGTIEVACNNGRDKTRHRLTHPAEALIVPPEDWHTMEFSPGAILLVLASHPYNKADYIFEDYP